MAKNNANFVKIPKDISLIKQKFAFGLTKRQLICFVIGLSMGLPAFFIIKALIDDITISVVALSVFSAPGIACGLYEKNGQHFEDKIKLLVKFLKLPKVRTYQSENMFDAIERNYEFDKYRKILKKAGINYTENEVKNSWLKKFNSQKMKSKL